MKKINDPSSQRVTCGMPIQIRDVNKDKRRIEFVASDETVDRYSSKLMVDGWDFKNFKNNPIFLFGHSYGSPAAVIGRVNKVRKDVAAKELGISVDFVPRDINPLAEMVFQMYAANPPFLNAVSVGFIPYDWEDVQMDWEKYKEEQKKGKPPLIRTYTKMELLEVSAVILPANPNALMDQAKAAGLDAASLMAARSCLSEGGDIDEVNALNAKMSEWLCTNGLCVPAEIVVKRESEEDQAAEDAVEAAPEPESNEDETPTDSEEARAGAVLSNKNKQALSSARDLVDQVLQEASSEKEGIDEALFATAISSIEPVVTQESYEKLQSNVLELVNYFKAMTQSLEEFKKSMEDHMKEIKGLVVQNELDEVTQDKVSVELVLGKWAAVGETQSVSK